MLTYSCLDGDASEARPESQGFTGEVFKNKSDKNHQFFLLSYLESLAARSTGSARCHDGRENYYTHKVDRDLWENLIEDCRSNKRRARRKASASTTENLIILFGWAVSSTLICAESGSRQR